jgi:carbon storage regulator CsrA
MLVLSRKKDQSILLKVPGHTRPIKITVGRIDNNNRVRLGIEAEKNITILRSELEPAVTTPVIAEV